MGLRCKSSIAEKLLHEAPHCIDLIHGSQVHLMKTQTSDAAVKSRILMSVPAKDQYCLIISSFIRNLTQGTHLHKKSLMSSQVASQ